MEERERLRRRYELFHARAVERSARKMEELETGISFYSAERATNAGIRRGEHVHKLENGEWFCRSGLCTDRPTHRISHDDDK